MVGVVRAAPSGARAAPPRAVVTWEGPGEPIMLTLYGPDGEVLAVPLLPKRALTLAQELLTRGVQAIRSARAAPWTPEGAGARAGAGQGAI